MSCYEDFHKDGLREEESGSEGLRYFTVKNGENQGQIYIRVEAPVAPWDRTPKYERPATGGANWSAYQTTTAFTHRTVTGRVDGDNFHELLFECMRAIKLHWATWCAEGSAVQAANAAALA